MFRFLIAALVLISLRPAFAQSESQQLLTSCTYGVLAGALVGAATLAVEDNPDDKLHRIARGASLGLYTGILLGLYVAYWVPNQTTSAPVDANRELEKIEGEPPAGDEYEEEDGQDPLEEYEEYEEEYPEDYGHMRIIPPPRMIIYPIIENQKITGAAVNVSVFQF